MRFYSFVCDILLQNNGGIQKTSVSILEINSTSEQYKHAQQKEEKTSARHKYFFINEMRIRFPVPVLSCS